MSLLSERQRMDLHKSMLDYLHASGFAAAFNALKEDTGTEYTPDPKAKYTGLLEKKWTSVIRLQKKVGLFRPYQPPQTSKPMLITLQIMDLENRNAALQEELSLSPARRAASQTDWVPRAPAAHVLTGHRAPITRVAFHPQYSILASASEDATVKIWDWETGEFERTLKGHTKAVMDVDFDHKGNLLVTCSSDLFIKIWDSQNEWKNTKTFPGHEHSVSAVRFMPGDQFIVSASRDRTIRVFDVASTHLVRTISGHSEWVRCIVPSEDGRMIASGSKDQTARIWDPLTGESKMELRGHEHDIEVIVFAPIAAYAAIRELGGYLSVFWISRIRLPNSTKQNTDRSKRHGLYVATGARDKTIKLWDTQSAWHDNWVRALAFHPSGKYLLSAADDKTIRVWELSTGRCMKTVDAHGHFVTTLAWGRQIAGANADKVESKADADAGPSAEPEKLVNVVASGSVDLTIKIWLP
ncbi:WD40-repeat-containing domain protein [Infundibulicybe gibba]|nr:WD40-repeat-containing domain protein [Infundibulicybe gibba]